MPSRGIERWISQELARRLGTGELGSDGVCANVAFPFPGRLIRDAVATASGIAPEDDPWLPERLTWPLLAIVEDDPTASLLGPLRAHVGGQDDDGTGLARRLGAVRHVADLFDRYGVHRPAMIRRWRAGEDVGPDGAALHPRHQWQPQLWRAVSDRVGRPSFAERHGAALVALRERDDLLDLPPRVAMFGLTALPATYLEVVAALGVHRDLHLLLLHPSRDLWDRVHDLTATTRGGAGDQALPLRDDDPTAEEPRNPLLRSWGRDVRELQLVTPLPAEASVTHHELGPEDVTGRPRPDAARAAAGGGARRRAPGAARRRVLRAPTPRTSPRSTRATGRCSCTTATAGCGRSRCCATRSCTCWPTGRARAARRHRHVPGHRGLRPADHRRVRRRGRSSTTARGRRAGRATVTDAPPALRVRLADRSLRGTNPVLEALSQVLELVDGRITASDVLDLAAREPVRERFGFAEDDLGTLESWVDDVAVRWGFDGAHRQRHGLPALEAHTWRAGLHRLLLGAAMADEDLRMVDGVVPFDGLEGQASDLAGRFVELVARLEDVLDGLVDPRPVDGWRDAIGAAADRLTATDADTVWQRMQLHRVLDDLVDDATVDGAPSPVALTLAEVRTTLAERLAGRPTTSSHRTGDLTFSTLVPMRSVPHRVVCLLGLDDGAFPRSTVADSDDLLAAAPRVGDRDARSEDRQLLLDALLAATETLVVTWAGRDVRTNEDRPPAVPVDELLDVIDRTVASSDDARPRTHLITRHPLAEHDHRNFTPGGLGRGAGRRRPAVGLRPVDAGRRHRGAHRARPGRTVPHRPAAAAGRRRDRARRPRGVPRAPGEGVRAPTARADPAHRRRGDQRPDRLVAEGPGRLEGRRPGRAGVAGRARPRPGRGGGPGPRAGAARGAGHRGPGHHPPARRADHHPGGARRGPPGRAHHRRRRGDPARRPAAGRQRPRRGPARRRAGADHRRVLEGQAAAPAGGLGPVAGAVRPRPGRRVRGGDRRAAPVAPAHRPGRDAAPPRRRRAGRGRARHQPAAPAGRAVRPGDARPGAAVLRGVREGRRQPQPRPGRRALRRQGVGDRRLRPVRPRGPRPLPPAGAGRPGPHRRPAGRGLPRRRGGVDRRPPARGRLGLAAVAADPRRRAATGAASERARPAAGCPERLRPARPAAVGQPRARGQRRHRQDLHHRRAGDPVGGRDRGAAAAPARGDLHPGGDRRAARPGPRPAGAGGRPRRGGAGRGEREPRRPGAGQRRRDRRHATSCAAARPGWPGR